MEAKEPNNLNEKKITIEIKSHDFLLKILQSRKQTWRIMTGLTIITLIFFLGLGIAVTILKTFYPYSSIQTTKYGSTIIKNDDKEVIYWLFNTAELWANSGIKVKKGDVITIRSSGSAHTAIHHLYSDAKKNSKQQMDWVKTAGIATDNNIRDNFRKRHRIFSNMPVGALVMQVIPDNIYLSNMIAEETEEAKDTSLTKKIDNELIKTAKNSTRFYYVGAERSNITISEAGILHFAVNDIILTNDIINEMMTNNLYEILTDTNYIKKYPTIKYLNSTFKSLINKNDSLLHNICYDIINLSPTIINKKEVLPALLKKYNLTTCNEDSLKSFLTEFNIKPLAYQFGTSSDVKEKTATILQNEMIYYKSKKYRKAWYDDNIGSFLIIIEKNGK